MIRIVLALAMLIALGHEATAESATAAPRLKELVAVSSDIVRIGDLVDNAGAAADIPVFRAPDLGQTGAVQVSRIVEALRPHDIAGIDAGGLSEVVVTHLSRAITAKDITDRIARAVAGQFGLGDARNLSVILDREVRILHVEPAVTGDLLIARMNVEPRNGRFTIAFELPGSAVARRLPLRFTGTVIETAETATLLRAIRPGEVIKASDVTVARRPKAEVGNEGVSAKQATGLAAKSALRNGQALRSTDLMKPQVVQRNESVTLVYVVPGVMLTVRGKALEAGAVGDVVGVLNIQSNRTIQATVTGPGRVAVAAAGALLAAASNSNSDESESPRTQ